VESPTLVVGEVQYSAHWYPDCDIEKPAALWEALRDAAGWPKGCSPASQLGESMEKCSDCNGTGRDNVPYGERCDECDGKGEVEPALPEPPPNTTYIKGKDEKI